MKVFPEPDPTKEKWALCSHTDMFAVWGRCWSERRSGPSELWRNLKCGFDQTAWRHESTTSSICLASAGLVQIPGFLLVWIFLTACRAYQSVQTSNGLWMGHEGSPGWSEGLCVSTHQADLNWILFWNPLGFSGLRLRWAREYPPALPCWVYFHFREISLRFLPPLAQKPHL